MALTVRSFYSVLVAVFISAPAATAQYSFPTGVPGSISVGLANGREVGCLDESGMWTPRPPAPGGRSTMPCPTVFTFVNSPYTAMQYLFTYDAASNPPEQLLCGFGGYGNLKCDLTSDTYAPTVYRYETKDGRSYIHFYEYGKGKDFFGSLRGSNYEFFSATYPASDVRPERTLYVEGMTPVPKGRPITPVEGLRLYWNAEKPQ